jgi:hypothetical protein
MGTLSSAAVALSVGTKPAAQVLLRNALAQMLSVMPIFVHLFQV